MVTDDDRAARLFGHLARFKGDLTAAQVYFNCMLHIFLKTSNTLPEASSGKS